MNYEHTRFYKVHHYYNFFFQLRFLIEKCIPFIISSRYYSIWDPILKIKNEVFNKLNYLNITVSILF